MNLRSSLDPPHSGGLLPALYLWRRLAVEGFSRFGEVYYLGTAPLVGREGLVDVIVGTHKGVECRFYFDPVEGQSTGLGNVSRRRRRSLRSVFFPISRCRRPHAARTHGSALWR